jgi:hypothetical protein
VSSVLRVITTILTSLVPALVLTLGYGKPVGKGEVISSPSPDLCEPPADKSALYHAVYAAALLAHSVGVDLVVAAAAIKKGR